MNSSQLLNQEPTLDQLLNQEPTPNQESIFGQVLIPSRQDNTMSDSYIFNPPQDHDHVHNTQRNQATLTAPTSAPAPRTSRREIFRQRPYTFVGRYGQNHPSSSEETRKTEYRQTLERMLERLEPLAERHPMADGNFMLNELRLEEENIAVNSKRSKESHGGRRYNKWKHLL